MHVKEHDAVTVALPAATAAPVKEFQRIVALDMLWRKGVFQRLFARLSAVGQMALTNYLMQSVLCTLFFFGYRLGFYERFAFPGVRSPMGRRSRCGDRN